MSLNFTANKFAILYQAHQTQGHSFALYCKGYTYRFPSFPVSQSTSYHVTQPRPLHCFSTFFITLLWQAIHQSLVIPRRMIRSHTKTLTYSALQLFIRNACTASLDAQPDTHHSFCLCCCIADHVKKRGVEAGGGDQQTRQDPVSPRVH